jgi:hypothetical protein
MVMRIRIRQRSPFPKPWKWEIVVDGRLITASHQSCATRREAYSAGSAALDRLTASEVHPSSAKTSRSDGTEPEP